jgi:hypothetical protein
MISPNEPEALAPAPPDPKNQTHHFRFSVDVIFNGSVAEGQAVVDDTSAGFRSVLRDVLLARLPVARARQVAVRGGFVDFLGELPKGCLKDIGFGSIIE